MMERRHDRPFDIRFRERKADKMALLAEAIVEEWMNRQSFFTRRGVKSGNSEIDLLGVKIMPDAVEAWHVEVQVSFRPVGYLGHLSEEEQKILNTKSPNSAKKRPLDILESATLRWIDRKFNDNSKQLLRRNSCCAVVDWKKVFVHGIMKDKEELRFISEAGIRVIDFRDVIRDICSNNIENIQGGLATDIAEVIIFYSNSKF